MSWFEDLKTPRISKIQANQRASKVPEGLWVKCPSCGEILQSKALAENLRVCSECEYHFRLTTQERISLLCDEAKPDKKSETVGVEFEEYGVDLVSEDPLEFTDTKPYRDRLRLAAEKTGIGDACRVGKAKLKGLPYHLGVFEFKFMGGSMGAAVGEKLCLLFQHALDDRLPAVIVSASGGARMQEGIVSLMQMARTSAMIQRMREKGLPFISILTDPTTGGVAASFSMLGDINVSEPNALIGFAGPRVIQQTIRQSLPEGFQKAEFLLKHGFLDRIIHRKDLSGELYSWMLLLGWQNCSFPKSQLKPIA